MDKRDLGAICALMEQENNVLLYLKENKIADNPMFVVDYYQADGIDRLEDLGEIMVIYTDFYSDFNGQIKYQQREIHFKYEEQMSNDGDADEQDFYEPIEKFLSWYEKNFNDEV
jgi:hypothetical protein